MPQIIYNTKETNNTNIVDNFDLIRYLNRCLDQDESDLALSDAIEDGLFDDTYCMVDQLIRLIQEENKENAAHIDITHLFNN